ncbi:MAG: integrase core domain-containing protein [Daejeonella sp.]
MILRNTCSKEYVDLLTGNNVAVSMTENGDPYENAIAERMNGILKSEFNLYNALKGLEETVQRIAESIRAYNQVRPHDSCDRLTNRTCITRLGITNCSV